MLYVRMTIKDLEDLLDSIYEQQKEILKKISKQSYTYSFIDLDNLKKLKDKQLEYERELDIRYLINTP